MARYCLNCKKATKHSDAGIGGWHCLHALITLLIAWPWLAIWIFHTVLNSGKVCDKCGCENK